MEAAVETVQDVPMTDETKAPAHARSGFRHWAVVAAGCAAVVAGALAANPAEGGVTPTRPPVQALQPAEAPDPTKAELPLDCGPFPVTVGLHFSAQLEGRPTTVAAAHCAADNGTPPDGAYLLTAGPDGKPVVKATLVRPEEGLTVTELKLRSDGTIVGRARGYSNDDVPRCCPDLVLDLTWTHKAGQWVRTETRAPAAGV
ncbi:hypothetical protein GCM10010193_48010 [Kitasatospora atroaurantiaca]|uniref:Uncharacterized protein n=2 Tax=Kitasatospora atroaurantiaca TaxID=285545 RepID=A0A561EYY7_9ACTN|nr:hypothetical protein FB465_5980 [Kitasatospora atroaurantiaca]